MSNEEFESFFESYKPSDYLPESRIIIEQIINVRQMDLENYQMPESEKVEEEIKLKGLRGWLILVGIGVVLSPLRLLGEVIPVFLPIFEEGTFEALTTVGSGVYSPHLATLIVGEIIFNIGMVMTGIYLIYLFFTKHYLFPKIYIAITLISIIFIPLDAWLSSLIVPNAPVFDAETEKSFIRLLFGGFIWIPYLLKSKRVKATFIEKVSKG